MDVCWEVHAGIEIRVDRDDGRGDASKYREKAKSLQQKASSDHRDEIKLVVISLDEPNCCLLQNITCTCTCQVQN